MLLPPPPATWLAGWLGAQQGVGHAAGGLHRQAHSAANGGGAAPLTVCGWAAPEPGPLPPPPMHERPPPLPATNCPTCIRRALSLRRLRWRCSRACCQRMTRASPWRWTLCRQVARKQAKGGLGGPGLGRPVLPGLCTADGIGRAWGHNELRSCRTPAAWRLCCQGIGARCASCLMEGKRRHPPLRRRLRTHSRLVWIPRAGCDRRVAGGTAQAQTTHVCTGTPETEA